MQTIGAGWAVGAMLVVVGCGTPFRGPEQGGARWVEARSDHFVLFTSGDEDAAKESLEQLEQTHAVFENVAFPSDDEPKGTTEVVLLPALEFDALAEAAGQTPHLVGYFVRAYAGLDTKPRLVVRGDLRSAARVLQHELTHRFVAYHFPSAPIWLHEGLAEFWETLDVKDGVAYFGGPVRSSVSPLRLEQLLGLSAEAFYSGDLTELTERYVSASALARVMYFAHRPVFTQYLNALKSGRLEPAAAWRHATDTELEGIRNDYDRFFHSPAFQGEIEAPVVTPSVDVADLSEAQVHLLWATLWPWVPRTAERVQHEIDTALALEPDSIDALALRAVHATSVGDHRRARKDMARALELGPFRSKALTAALYLALHDQQPFRIPNDELARRLLRFQTSARQLNLLSQHFAASGDVDRALQLTTRAVRIDSSCVECYLRSSRLFEQRGDMPKALAAQRTGVTLAGEHIAPHERQRLRQLEMR